LAALLGPLALVGDLRGTASACVRICSPPNATVVSPRRHRRRSRWHRLGAANDSFFSSKSIWPPMLDCTMSQAER
jgi:hypothetical protein